MVFMHYRARAIEPCQSWTGIAGPAVVPFELCPGNCNCSAETHVALQTWLHLYWAFLVCGFFFFPAVLAGVRLC